MIFSYHLTVLYRTVYGMIAPFRECEATHEPNILLKRFHHWMALYFFRAVRGPRCMA